MTTYTVANLKGGTTKSTSCGYLAHALPGPTLGVDADPPGSLLRWSELGNWSLPVIGLAVKDLHKRLPGLSRGYADVVIDTPPLDEHAGIVYSALRAADVVVVPVSPTTMELDRLTPVLAAVEEVAPLREQPPIVKVLLTRVVGGANSGSTAREVLTEGGLEVLQAHIPRLERYAQSFGAPVTLVPGDPYQAVADELQAAAKEAGL
ncbi:MAG: hypothetical protein ACRDTJ_29590 [Pseudonocardiaceae bacterium]